MQSSSMDSINAQLGSGRSIRLSGPQTVIVFVICVMTIIICLVIWRHEDRMMAIVEENRLVTTQIHNGYLAHAVALSQVLERVDDLEDKLAEHKEDTRRWTELGVIRGRGLGDKYKERQR